MILRFRNGWWLANWVWVQTRSWELANWTRTFYTFQTSPHFGFMIALKVMWESDRRRGFFFFLVILCLFIKGIKANFLLRWCLAEWWSKVSLFLNIGREVGRWVKSAYVGIGQLAGWLDFSPNNWPFFIYLIFIIFSLHTTRKISFLSFFYFLFL